MKFISKPVEVEAVRYINGESLNDVVRFMGEDSDKMLDLGFFPNIKVRDKLHMNALIPVLHGQWIIRGTKGEYYPCDHGVFLEKYEEVK